VVSPMAASILHRNARAGSWPRSGGYELDHGRSRLPVRLHLSRRCRSTATLYDVIAALRPKWERGRIQGHLGRFGFFRAEVQRRANSLSGGERARVALAILMLSGANLFGARRADQSPGCGIHRGAQRMRSKRTTAQSFW